MTWRSKLAHWLDPDYAKTEAECDDLQTELSDERAIGARLQEDNGRLYRALGDIDRFFREGVFTISYRKKRGDDTQDGRFAQFGCGAGGFADVYSACTGQNWPHCFSLGGRRG